MRNERKIQAALEFLMTYGWAILVVLIAVGALAYYVDPNSASTIGTGSDYKVRIYDYNNPAVYDESDFSRLLEIRWERQ